MVAKMAESKKRNKCKDLVNNFEFMPVAVKTLGSQGTESLKFIKEIGKRIQENTGEKRATAYFIQSISMSIHWAQSDQLENSMKSMISLHL